MLITFVEGGQSRLVQFPAWLAIPETVLKMNRVSFSAAFANPVSVQPEPAGELVE